MFAVQKEKKAKEAKENEGKNPQSNDANQKTAAMENRNPQILVDGMNYNSQPNGGGPVENDMQLGYNPALGRYHNSQTLRCLSVACQVCAQWNIIALSSCWFE